MAGPGKGEKIDTHKIAPFTATFPAVVFVPGIMGSRVRFDGKSATITWEPDSLGDKLALLWDMWESVPTLQEVFDPYLTPATVLNATWPEGARDDTGFDVRVRRGFLTVLTSKYAKFLAGLQVALDPNAWSNRGSGTAPRIAPYPAVYACGYDFRHDNKVSAGRLGTFIREVVLADAANEKVIIVSHSMGGLVTRAMLMNPSFADVKAKVLGVIHVGQPVDGAAESYRTLISGPEGALGKLFGTGTNGRLVVSVLPSLHQLLPNQLYMGGPAGWLSRETSTTTLPTVIVDPWSVYLGGDPIVGIPPLFDLSRPDGPSDAEVQAEAEWQWRVAGGQGETPDGMVDTIRQRMQEEAAAKLAVWTKAKTSSDRNVGLARAFHTTIGRSCHDKTRPLAVARFTDTEETIVWSGGDEVSWEEWLRRARAELPSGAADRIVTTRALQLRQPHLDDASLFARARSGPGDGTVPLVSGAALPGTETLPECKLVHADMMNDPSVVKKVVELYWSLQK